MRGGGRRRDKAAAWIGEIAAAHGVVAGQCAIAGGRRDVVRTWASWANWAEGKTEKEWAK